MGASEVVEQQQEFSINDGSDVTVVTTTVTTPQHHSLDPLTVRGKIWAFSFVFYQALLCIFMFNPYGIWWIVIGTGYVAATYSIFSRRLCLVYFHFGVSCFLYMLLVFYCITMSYTFGYYLSAGWSLMSFIFSFIEITFYASCLKFYARYIKALKAEKKNGEYVPVSTTVEIEVEPSSATAPQPQQQQPRQANYYPAQMAQFAQAQQPVSPAAAAPVAAPLAQPQQPYFVPVNIPFGQQIQSIQVPHQGQQGQQQYYPMQYYYVVPSMPNPNIAVDKN